MSLILPDQAIENPELATLDGDGAAYRVELVRTLAHCFKINLMNNPDVARSVDAGTVARFTHQMQTLPVADLEKRLEALRIENPGLVMEAMQAAGHNVTTDDEGNVRIGDPNVSLAGSYVDVEEFMKG